MTYLMINKTLLLKKYITQIISNYLRAAGEDVIEYRLYLDMMKNDGRQSAGMGLGIEQLLSYLLG